MFFGRGFGEQAASLLWSAVTADGLMVDPPLPRWRLLWIVMADALGLDPVTATIRGLVFCGTEVGTAACMVTMVSPVAL